MFGVPALNCNEWLSQNGQQFSKTDLLIVGSGVYARRMGTDLEKILQSLPKGLIQKAVIFGTIGGQISAIKSMERILNDKGIEVIGSFYCKGQAWYFFNHGRPNQQDLSAVREFAQNIKAEL